MPLHRVIALAIFVCRTKQYFRDEAYKSEKLYNESDPQIDRIALQGCAMNVAVCTDNEKICEDIKLLQNALATDDELFGERVRRLAAILRDMGY